MKNAYKDLLNYIEDDEKLESIVFGAYGWGSQPRKGENWEYGFGERGEHSTLPPTVPFDVRGKVLSVDDAKQYMQGWSFFGGFGSPECYAVYVWTNKRVIWVTQYDGATGLDSAPRNPLNIIPNMPGG